MRDLSPTSNRAESPDKSSEPSAAAITAQLRLLATTDIHMQLIGYDFASDRQLPHSGMAGLATLIDDARTEAATHKQACLLLDNGDLLQGTAMGCWLSQAQVGPRHPVVSILNTLQYDAIGIGNHDLDYGLSYLTDIAGHLNAKVLASNLEGETLAPMVKSALLRVPLECEGADTAQHLKVGLVSVLPVLTNIWSSEAQDGRFHAIPGAACLRTHIPRLQAEGADLIIALAHMGLPETADSVLPSEDTALALAEVPGIDAMIMGHTHRRFPGQDVSRLDGVDDVASTLLNVPAMMPGHGGSDLGVMDLTLSRSPGQPWRITEHAVSLRKNASHVPPSPAILRATDKAKRDLRHYMASVVGQLEGDLHNYFSLAAPTSTGRFCADAKARLVQKALHGTPHEALPLLATASAHTAGGREGPDNYLHIPKGPVLRRHLKGLDPYSNQIWALRLSGQALRRHLETAAGVYSHLTPDQEDQPLLNASIAAYNFDTVYGVTYAIDPTRPLGDRIIDLCHKGQPVRDTDTFALVTSQFRAAGGGGYDAFKDGEIIRRCTESAVRAYTEALNEPDGGIFGDAPPWHLECGKKITARFAVPPSALPHLWEISDYAPEIAGIDSEGFAQLRLTF